VLRGLVGNEAEAHSRHRLGGQHGFGALARVAGSAPVLAGGGRSIPIVGEFERILDAQVLLMGFSMPGANLHAPNEWFPEENIELGVGR